MIKKYIKISAITASLLIATSNFAFADEKKDSVLLDAVTIQETVSDLRVDQADTSVTLGVEDILESQATTFGDIMKNVPSVMVEETGGQQGSVIYVRGLRGDQISVRVEGAPKNFTQTRHGGTDDIWLDTTMYKSVSVVPGASANTYGNGSLGGVVLIETKDPEDIIKDGRDWGANLQVGTETNPKSFMLSTDFAKKINEYFSFNATVTKKKYDPYKDANGNKDDEGTTGTDDLSYLLKAVVTPTSEQRAELSIQENTKEYTASGRGGIQDTEVTDRTLTASYNYSPLENKLINLKISASKAKSDRDRRPNATPTDPWTTWGVDTNYFEITNSSIIEQSDLILHNIRIGADYTHDDITSAYSDSNGDLLLRERTAMGAYISDTVSFGDFLELGASVRFDTYDASQNDTDLEGESSYSPKLSAYLTPFEDKGLAFSAIAGKSFRAPSVHEFFGRGEEESCTTRRGVTTCTQRQANEDLKGETSKSYELGVKYHKDSIFSENDNLSTSLNYIHNDIEDMIASEDLGSYTNGSGDTVNVSRYTNVNKAIIKGWEALIQYDNNIWFTSLAYQNLDGYGVEEDGSHSPLTYFSPDSLNTTLGMYFNDGRGQIGVERFHRGDYQPDGLDERWQRHKYTYYNLFGTYSFTKDLSLQFRVNNITDKLYTTGAKTEDSGVDTTTYAAGRNFKFTLNYSF